MELWGRSVCYMFPLGTEQEYFYVSVSLFLGDETMEVVITCGRRPGDKNKSQGHDRVYQFEAEAKCHVWD